MSREIYRRYGFDKLLFLAVLGMIAFGLVMVFSSSAPRGIEERGNSFYYFVQQVIGAVAGLALLLGIMFWSRPFYRNPVFVYGMLTVAIGLLAMALVMPAVRNANRWIHIAGFRFQPSELAKISLVMFLAYYLDRKKEALNDFRTLVLPIGVIGLVLLLVLKEPDVSTSLLIGTICAVMLFLSGVRLSHLAVLGVTASALLTAIILKAPAYVRERIMSFISPEASLQDAGYQAYQSKLALGSGGIFGSSIGQGSGKLNYLPDSHTDYIYSIVGEELGLIGALGVLFLFGVFIWRGLVISRRAPDSFSRILAGGLTLMVGIQALLNISIVLGLAPTTGLPLPFFSYGRSSLICTMFAVGLLLHISQRKTTQRRK